jgi:hypothetical protein
MPLALDESKDFTQQPIMTAQSSQNHLKVGKQSPNLNRTLATNSTQPTLQQVVQVTPTTQLHDDDELSSAKLHQSSSFI